MHSLHSITGTSYLTRHKHFIHSIVSSLSLALTRSHKFAATFSTSFFLLLLSLYFECFCISLTSNWNALKLYHHTANFSQVVVLFVSLLSLALIFPAINSHPMLHSLFFSCRISLSHSCIRSCSTVAPMHVSFHFSFIYFFHFSIQYIFRF